MRVFVTGATGFLGRALVLRLQRDGHQVLAWVRDLERGRSLLGADVELVPADDDATLAQGVARSEAIVNLAGASILGGRWTAVRRRVLAESRVGVTDRIVRILAGLSRRPAVLVSASAVGFYGDRRDEVLTEGAGAGGDFLAQLCRDWEAAAERARDLGVRVARIRMGVVLGRGGGALAKMLPAFRLGVGGPVGSGRQYVPWIHLEDVVSIFAAALADERWVGPANGTAPTPVTSRELARALGAALHRPALLPIPALLLEAIFGQAATVLLASQRAIPTRPEELGFSFAFPTIAAALADLVGDAGVRRG